MCSQLILRNDRWKLVDPPRPCELNVIGQVEIDGMEIGMASSAELIKAVMEERAAAMAARDIDRLMAVYTTDVVYFDLVPPLSYSGAPALRERFLDWFGRWESPIGQRVDHLEIISGADVATAFMLIEASGTLKGGRDVKYWVRTTNGLRRIDGSWHVAHEHVSLPVDMATRTAVMDLIP